ncbi:F-box/WD repeat-containing protein 11 [Thelohanellus kitauei]|uniref:F-box/WD repeat-containing protein 11 n=1 Tax=Thelohanellus kitauei TaxID=669202 RepID=A0A0C2MN67_THEKT|nr:F-box/WD repeat-containing protein 11 [Thelohanellus kitauei]
MDSMLEKYDSVQELFDPADGDGCVGQDQESSMPKSEIAKMRSRLQDQLCGDLITNLINLNCHHVTRYIWGFLDPRSLSITESVCQAWRRDISNSNVWQSVIKQMVKRSNTWRDLSNQRGWHLYLNLKPYDVSPNFFRELYWNILRDIKVLDLVNEKLQNNWNFASCTYERIVCGNVGEFRGIYCFQFTDKYLYSGHRDHLIRVWDMTTRELQAVMSGHQGSVLSLRLDGSLLVSASSDSTIRLWSLKTLGCLQVISHHNSSVLHVWFVGDRMVSSSKDKTLAVWKLKNEKFELQACLKGHHAAVNAVEFDDKYIVSASGDTKVRIWSWENYQCVNILSEHRRGIACLHYRYPTLLTGSSDADIRIWDVDKGICIRVLKGHSQLIRCIYFNDRHIISGSVDGSIRIWNLKIAMMPSTVPLVTPLTHHTDRVLRIQADQLKFVSSSHDDTIIIWNFLDSSMNDPSLWRPKRIRNSVF